jgi:hypothetical protein
VASLANATSKVFAVGLNGFLYAAGTITVYVNTESQRVNQNNVSEWSNMSTHGLLFQ